MVEEFIGDEVTGSKTCTYNIRILNKNSLVMLFSLDCVGILFMLNWKFSICKLLDCNN